MIELYRFIVLGEPGPQGSKTRMPNGAMVEAASATGRAKTKAWRTAVAEKAADVVGPPLDGPIAIDVTFRFRMPQSRKASARTAGVGWHTVKPDKDKLLRATLDGLKAGGAIADDARVCSIRVAAIEVQTWTGAVVIIGTPGCPVIGGDW